MALIKYKLGQLLDRNTETNDKLCYGISDVRGVLNSKGISETKADVVNRDLSKFLVVRPGGFIFNHRVHDKLGLGYNTSNDVYIFTNDYVAFYIKKDIENKVLLPEYLYMWYLRTEFDRYMLFKTYGSATLFFNWDNMCDLDIELPDIAVQAKYVAVYKAMLENQKNYERGLDDLKLTCDSYIEELRRKIPPTPIKRYLCEKSIKAGDFPGKYTSDNIAGISSISKSFMDTKADTKGLSINSYNVVEPNDFSFNPNTARMGDRIPIALNDSDHDYLVSAIYPVFSVDEKYIIPEYLMMWFKRPEFDRYARFHSWGSARETFDYPDVQEVSIPIPDKEVQQDIVDIYKVYIERIRINEQLKRLTRELCPILIKGAIESAKKG